MPPLKPAPMRKIATLCLCLLIALGAGLPGPALAAGNGHWRAESPDPGHRAQARNPGRYRAVPVPAPRLRVQGRRDRSYDFAPPRGNRGRGPRASPFVPFPPRDPAYRSRDPARDALRRGEIRSLAEVANVVQRRFPGRLLDVRLEQGRRVWVYHLKVLTRSGRVLRIAVDARTARILGVSGGR